MTEFTYSSMTDELDSLLRTVYRLQQEAGEHMVEFEELEREYADLGATIVRLKGALKVEDEPPVEEAARTIACPHPDCGAMLKFKAAPPFVSLCLCHQVQVHVVEADGAIVATEMPLATATLVTREEFMLGAKIAMRFADDFGRRYARVEFGDWACEVLTHAAKDKPNIAAVRKDAVMTLAWSRYCADR